MKKFYIFYIIFFALLSCKNKKDESTPEPIIDLTTKFTKEGYMPLTKGSYWIYERYDIDKDGNEIASPNKLDSVFVEKDTIIGNKIYRKTKSIKNYSNTLPLTLNIIAGDSNGYFINPIWEGFNIILPPTNSSIEYSYSYTNTWSHWDYKMKICGVDSLVTVPAGTFKSINFREFVTVTQTDSENIISDYNHHIYSSGVGLIKQQCSTLSGEHFGARLIRYHIE